MNEEDNIELQIVVDYDISGEKKNMVNFETPVISSTHLGAPQRIRMIADRMCKGWEKKWKPFIKDLENKKDYKYMDWKKLKTVHVRVNVNGMELAYTRAGCLPSEFPQCVHALVENLASGMEVMAFDMTAEDKLKMQNGEEITKGDMTMRGYQSEEEDNGK